MASPSLIKIGRTIDAQIVTSGPKSGRRENRTLGVAGVTGVAVTDGESKEDAVVSGVVTLDFSARRA